LQPVRAELKSTSCGFPTGANFGISRISGHLENRREGAYMAEAMDNALDEARQRVDNIRARLPCSVSFADLGVRSKAPYLLLCIREALIWRTEELARCACDLLSKDDVAAGILLTRAVIENTAVIWRLRETLEARHTYSPADLDDKFEKMLLGWKTDPDFPRSVNSLTMIDHMDRQFHGVRERYDELSEFAHPNWSGVFGLFSVIDSETYTTKFGRGLRKTPSDAKEIAATALRGYLELFEQVYNSISNSLPKFIEELEPIES
jgi:hypothetical protein